MAKKTVTICDKCGRQTDAPASFHLTVDRRLDASGNGYEDWSVPVDLCVGCAAQFAVEVTKSLAYENAAELAKKWAPGRQAQ